MSDLDNRAIVNEVCDNLIAESDKAILLEVALALETAQHDFLERDEHTVDLTDTVSAGLDTTFASSLANTGRARKRHGAIELFQQVNQEQCNAYLLHEFAGRTTDEIAELETVTANDVSQRLSIARAEIEAIMDE
ncbi:hypothetical protein [Thalassoglobus neptunius]|uniref:hypothetical protein n=1 Tax=Thalassoglobus neptunius TaxID=1938619 RepID=UPI001E2C543F|nr:hypothetical protein [Thalassoglobus neptunius]